MKRGWNVTWNVDVECGREMCLWNVHAKLMKRGWNVKNNEVDSCQFLQRLRKNGTHEFAVVLVKNHTNSMTWILWKVLRQSGNNESATATS